MESHKLVVKFFIEDPSSLSPGEFVPVFHSWIQSHAIDDHLLIDVADYQHVPDGPGTVLVAHEANYHMDKGGGRFGLLYSRKQPIPGTFRDHLRQAFAAALEACVKLEEHPTLSGRLKFRTDEIVFRINDRLLAPNTPETFTAVKGDLQQFLSDLFRAAVGLEHRASPDELFEVRIRPPQALPVTALLARLAAAAVPSR